MDACDKHDEQLCQRIPISIFTFDPALQERWGQEGGLWAGKGLQGIDINADHMKSDADMTVMLPSAGHELFHVLQNLYDARPFYSIASLSLAWIVGGPWLWYDEAASTWFERRLAGDSYIPSTVVGESNNWELVTAKPPMIQNPEIV